MGCLISKFAYQFGFSTNSTDEISAPDKLYSWDKREKVDPSLYTIENLVNEEVGRLPGSIDGQQFIIQNCMASRIFLLDCVNTITIDDCQHTMIFIGPTVSSVFLRNCKDCLVAAACGQFRTRDCQRIDVFLYCQTQPIIESSIKMQFGCLQVTYKGFHDHMERSRLSHFNNNWSDVHDFTPVVNEKNWTACLPPEALNEQFRLPQIPGFELMDISFKPEDSLIPYTIGSPSYGSKEACLVIHFYQNNYQDQATKYTVKMQSNSVDLQYSREVKLECNDLSRIFKGTEYRDVAGKGPVIALLFTGNDCVRHCRELSEEFMESSESHIFTTDGSEGGSEIINSFFSYSLFSIGI